ncbi:hypothetical protein JAAARDRAFT_203283 [Jaapia argillacea MUCL 33604]|uniref:F-box domain-containing protein n=1 Tax=Jaapia argillacea MUCL 33604 TaxID=933084 RepID=A0A067QHI0_9AGAM|nr:hypothetical protein JAAARDRAFT_203283 [Jaapia argillacea MUCL 33604]
MHKCLTVTDIVTKIFQNLDGNESTLAALARTCQAFHAPALDVLWRVHHGLTALVKCLSPSSWAELRTTDAEGRTTNLTLVSESFRLMLSKYLIISTSQKIKRGLTPSDCTRFDYYAARVKTLRLPGERIYFGFTPSYPVDDGVFQELSRCRPNHILFPNLLELEWSYFDYSLPHSTIPSIHLFLSPSIKTFSLLRWGDLQQGAIDFLQFLRHTSPFIEVLTLPRSNGISVAGQLIAEICQFPHLRHLDVHFETIPPEEIVHLATLSNLEGLDLFLDNVFTINQLRSETHIFPLALTEHKPFAGLRSLRIGGKRTDLATCMALLSWISPCTLTELSFVTNPPSPALLRQNLAALSATCSHSTLQNLQMNVFSRNDVLGGEDIQSRTIDSASLFPLLAFHKLEHVELTSCPVALDDATLEKMAHAWPGLTVLHFESSLEAVNVTSVTLAGLIPLARICTRLVCLSIGLHAASQAIETRIEGTFPNPSLESLNLGRSTIVTSGSSLIADFLFHVFPKLTDFDVWNDIRDEGEASERCQAWGAVWTRYDQLSGGHLHVYDE